MSRDLCFKTIDALKPKENTMNYMKFRHFMGRECGFPLNEQVVRQQWQILQKARDIGEVAFTSDAHDATVHYWNLISN